MRTTPGARLRDEIASREILPFIGIYDAFSAALAARHFEALFVSGFGFAASHHGLPDVGFVTWSEIAAFVQRLRAVLPEHHLLVDIDDGYGDPEVAAHVVTVLEGLGASAVVLEDQRRPRRCGHFDGKQMLGVDEYVPKLERVLTARRDLVVIARTDSSDPDDIVCRMAAYADAGADAVLADGLKDLAVLRAIRARVRVPVAFNQIAGGKSAPCTLGELREAGASLAIYSTPCLFAAQSAIEDAMIALREHDGSLARGHSGIGVADCTAVLNANLGRSANPER
jgi:2-methylisocitrate lyase-like PEP mutase family enzyme